MRLKRTSPQIKNNADSTTKRAQWSSPFLDYIDLLLKENHFIKQSIVYSLTMHVSLNNTHLKNWRGTNMYIIIMVVYVKKNVLTGTGEYYLTLIGYTSIKNIQKKEKVKNTFKLDILNSYSLLVK